MRLQTDQLHLGNDVASVIRALHQWLPNAARQVNAISEGRITGHHNALEAPPEVGMYTRGDYIRNKSPEVLGTAGNQYVIKGWVCVAGGEPGAWVQDRGLTGT